MAKRRRGPLLVAMGVGVAALAGGAAIAAARRTARTHRTGPDPRADDAGVFDLDVLGVEHHRIATPDGGELHAVEKGPKDARPLVLLHGISLEARVWGYQLRDLSDRFRVIAVDLRGHGGSRPGSDGYGMPRLATDLKTVLEALDLRDTIVVGHSMGGMTLMRFCGDHPDVLDERVAGVVFLATMPLLPVPALAQRAIATLAPRLHGLGERRGWDRMPSRRIRDEAISYLLIRRIFGRDASPTHVALSRELVLGAPTEAMWPSGLGIAVHNAEEALESTKTPALVIGGELDNLLPPAMSRRIAELLPNAELHILDDAGHQLMLERPEKLAELLDQFSKDLASV